MAWWQENPIRMIQNNMRDIDAAMDVDDWIKTLKEFGCNVAMIGVGGITSFFPTGLEFQCESPYLPQGRDLIEEIMEKCHKEGIRVIGRFDFGRTHEKFYEEHKDWYYRSLDGRILRCEDTVTTCISGWYQQEYSLEIIREALERYPSMDGIFFNAFGFSGWDYYGNNYGVCHCDCCQKKFKEQYGMELPDTEDSSEPAHAAYKEFQRGSVAGALANICTFTKQHYPGLCVCTYSVDQVDMIRNESNTGIGRAYPFPLMSASLNVMSARHSWPDQLMANCVINATDLRWRYAGVSPNLTEIRLYEDMASGGCVDFCINGIFADYPDRASLRRAQKVFHYHEENERYYRSMVSKARVAIMRSASASPIHDNNKDMLGVFKALKEAHIIFDILLDEHTAKHPQTLSPYQLVIVPDVKTISAEAVAAVHKANIPLFVLAADAPLPEGIAGELALQITQTEADNAGAYMYTQEKDIFRSFADKDWVCLCGAIGFADAPTYRAILPYMSKGTFGPAERAYGSAITDKGCMYYSEAQQTLVIPWQLGYFYYQHGFQDHKQLLIDAIDHFVPKARALKTDAHPSVEMFLDDCGEGTLLQLVNLSGFNGTTIEEPIPMAKVVIEVPFAAAQITSLNGNAVHMEIKGESTLVTVEHLELYAAVVLK
ncbi:MAG: hypothetical protein GX096_10320 [Clostridiales bacterium]|nr:hypothetical protein [Clostridiales bacterium]